MEQEMTTTIQSQIKKGLTDLGMFDSQADEIVKRVKNNPKIAEQNINWNTDYPDSVYRIIWSFYVIEEAKKYIDEKCPKAWFRPMFFGDFDR